MDYFSILNLDREPFSNSPDPDFFFQSRQHVDCLQKLELALRLKRGLNIVIGAVGSGKTTLCRTLLKRLSSDSTIESHLILDPSFNSPLNFLKTICSTIVGMDISADDDHRFKEQIKHHLFQKGVDEKKTVVLIIDEGQKLPVFCLEILREFLNYETNDHKLLQIVLFAQEEFHEILDHRANLADRVNMIHFLGPMSFADTRQMVIFRIKQASSQPRPPELFSWMALRAIYGATGGYPRKIINLCHQCMLALIVQNRTRVDWRLVRSCRDRSLAQRSRPHRHSRALVYSTLAVFAIIGMIYFVTPGLLQSIYLPVGGNSLSTMQAQIHPSPLKATSPSLLEKPAQKEAHPATVPAVAPLQAIPAVVAAIDKVAPDPVHEIATSDRQTAEDDGAQPKPPSLLGALTVMPNDTLGLMLKVIYGDFRSRYMKAVLDANPHIRHADDLRVGDTIAFPAIPTPFVQRPYPLWWLTVGEAESLEAAFRRSIKASESRDAPFVRVISVWNPQTGLKYRIYVAGFFFNPSAAENMMAKLPIELSGSAAIISGWPTATVFFADPFLGKGY